MWKALRLTFSTANKNSYLGIGESVEIFVGAGDHPGLCVYV